jgi:hypothetical protein
MRFLGILVGLQCAGIAFLVWRSLVPDQAPAATQAATAPVPAGTAWQAAASGAPDEERLRRIIREELAALPVAGATGLPATVAAAPRDAERDRAQREQVAAQIAHYRSVGRMSEAEMLGLQQDIAKLDPASRREMLATLTRAVNAREIQAPM